MPPKTILVTGAGGFVGGALVRRLAKQLTPGERVIATDLTFPNADPLPGVEYLSGTLEEPRHLDALTKVPLHRVFHLATVAGVQSSDFKLGKRVNLTASIALFDRLAEQSEPPRLVYASSVGVFGKPFPRTIDDNTMPNPYWSYGAHKWVCEILINDYTRAGLLDGCALRFPGIVARPEGSTTMLSAFINNVFYAARSGTPFKLPMGPEDGTLLMSLRCCLDNLMLASTLPADQYKAPRAYSLPALYLTMAQLVDALADVYGSAVKRSITYEPNEHARYLFAMVPIQAERALGLGMKGDASAIDLVRNAIADNPLLMPVVASG